MSRFSKEVIGTVKESTVAISNELTAKISGYMVGALGVVAGLAWNEAIKGLIEYFFPAARNTVVAQFVYAITISLIVIIASIIIMKATKKAVIERITEQKEEKKEQKK